MERESAEGWIHVYVCLRPLAVHRNYHNIVISYASIQNKKLKKKHTSETEKIHADETDGESAWNTISQKHQSVTCCSCCFGASDPKKMQKKLMHSFGDPRCFFASLENRSPCEN